MKHFRVAAVLASAAAWIGCTSFQSVARHELASGTYHLKSPRAGSSRVYLDVTEDSLTVYPLKDAARGIPDTASGRASDIRGIVGDHPLVGCRFSRSSLDIDLATILMKYRPSASGVPVQLNSHVNAVVYAGGRKDYYYMRTRKSSLKTSSSFIQRFGYDAGFFAGPGIVPVNPTVTRDHTSLEYDGIVFQKGAAVFITLDHVSVGLALGFDNLFGPDASHWIYQNRPWYGLSVGIANF
jgi:hypothetical protein